MMTMFMAVILNRFHSSLGGKTPQEVANDNNEHEKERINRNLYLDLD